MRRAGSTILFPVAAALLLSNTVLAYDDKTTHPALTQEIVDFYNQSATTKIASIEKEWIIQGSILEDEPPRWINHFYDPVHDVGWTGEKAGELYSSVVKTFSFLAFSQEEPLPVTQWVKSSLIQSTYRFYGGDRTWQKAMEYYADGNKEEAYKTLGYVLHLLEDMGVPDHTRNDTHAPISSIDIGSPYEDYARKYTRETIKDLKILDLSKSSAISKDSVEDYLKSLAQYSNKYFFSKDTINDAKYLEPKILKEDYRFIYGEDENKEIFPLALVTFRTGDSVDISKSFSFANKEEYYPILDAYFSRLSHQVVLHGAGVIDLFEKKGKEAVINKEYPQHLVKLDLPLFTLPVVSFYSLFDKAMAATQGFFANIGEGLRDSMSAVTNLFVGEDEFEKVGEIVLNSSSDNAESEGLYQPETLLVSAPKSRVEKKEEEKTVAKKSKIEKSEAKIKEAPKKQKKDVSPDEESTPREALIKKEKEIERFEPEQKLGGGIIPVSCDFETNQLPRHSPVLLNEIAWMGTVENAANEWMELKNISNQAVNLSQWRLYNKKKTIEIDFPEMQMTASSFALLERSDDDSAPGVPADLIYVGGIGNGDDGLRLFDENCNLIDEVLTSSPWPAGDNGLKKTMERDRSGFGWHTSADVGGTPRKENSLVSIEQNNAPIGGGGSVASSIVPVSNATKLLITEFQITGGSGQTGDDFIEIYNPNEAAINLNGYRLVKRTKTGTSDTSIKSWTSDIVISPRGYYLWANSDYVDIPATPDGTTSASIANDNGIAIRLGAADTGTIIDSVGWGNAENIFFEGSRLSNPGANQSWSRKQNNGSFMDTDNNEYDFELKTCPDPKGQIGSCEEASSASFYSSSTAAHVVISEVYPDQTGANADFIELYNPLSTAINLGTYSIVERKLSETTEISLISFPSSEVIEGRSFFLIGFDEYGNVSSSAADANRSSKSLFTTTSTKITLLDGESTVDEMSYDPAALDDGQSYERKAVLDGICVAADGENEFGGNGCDVEEFTARAAARPQNKDNLPEPRTLAAPDANVSHSTSTMDVLLRWEAVADESGATSSVSYKVWEENNTTSSLTTATEWTKSVVEVNRTYHFILQAVDRDGFESATSSIAYQFPGLFSSFFWHQDPEQVGQYIIEGNYNEYPFIPNVGEDRAWRAVVFYRNNDPVGEEYLDDASWEPTDSANTVAVPYENCAGGRTARVSLMLPDTVDRCGTPGGAYNVSLKWDELEDRHFLVRSSDLGSADYLTMAFYSTFSIRPSDGRVPHLKLAAIDKTKHSLTISPVHQAPVLTGSVSSTFDESNSEVTFSWPAATDPDTIDSRLAYEYQTTSSASWIAVGNAQVTEPVSFGDSLSFAVRAVDEFGVTSTPLTTAWEYPDADVFWEQVADTESSDVFGKKDGTGTAYSIAQSMVSTENRNLHKVAVRVSQPVAGDAGNLRMRLVPDDGGLPDLENELGSSTIDEVYRPDSSRERVFTFSPAVSVTASTTYWLVMDVSSYVTGNGYEAWFRNQWRVITGGGDPYPEGKTGQLEGVRFRERTGDWYMKLAE